MAKLQKCKECGKEISKNAKVCPYCGEPKPIEKGMSLSMGLVLILMVALGYSIFNDFTNLGSPKESPSVKVIKTACEQMANRIKTLRYITAHNNNDQHKYSMDRLKTKEVLEKFELNKCNNNLLSDNSWNPLTDGTIKK